jgi:PKD repeat protein
MSTTDDGSGTGTVSAVLTPSPTTLPVSAPSLLPFGGSHDGAAVATDGSTIVTGAPYDSQVTMRVRSGAAWVNQGTFTDLAIDGSAVAVDGDTAAVNATDGVRVYARSGTSWALQATLTDDTGGVAGQFGRSIEISGNTMAIGAPNASSSNVYIFVRTGTSWVQQAKLIPTLDATGLAFGTAVSLDGDRLLVGATGTTINRPGAVYFYQRSGSGWTEQQRIANPETLGPTKFGASLQHRGDSLVVNTGTENHAYFFRYNGTAWVHQTWLWNYSVNGDGVALLYEDTIIVGDSSPAGGSPNPPDRVWIYRMEGDFWQIEGLLSNPNNENVHYFGQIIAAYNGLIVISEEYQSDVWAYNAPVRFSVTKDGPGSGVVTSSDFAINCGSDCTGDFTYGQSVTLNATPNVGWDFTGWSGACSGSNPTCVFSADYASQVNATFSKIYSLDVSLSGSGTGTIASSQPGLICSGGFCYQDVISGTLVTLTATPGASSDFGGWGGACTNPSGACLLTMSGNRSATAEFNVRAITSIDSVSPPAPVTGQPFTVSYSVTPPDAGFPSGSVTIVSSGGGSCSGDAPSGSCMITPSVAGSFTLTATYSGDFDYGGSSGTAPITVQKAATSLTISGATPAPALVGEPVTVSFSVSVDAPGAGSPSGLVTVSDGDGSSCSGPVSLGSCTLTPSHAGGKTLTASYAGSAAFAASQSTLNHTINPAQTQALIQSILPVESYANQPYTVTFKIEPLAPGGGLPAGTVTITNSDGQLCSAAAPSGSCAFTPTLAGVKSFHLSYAGNADYAAGVLDFSHEILKADAVVLITSDEPDGAERFVPVTVTYTIGADPPWAGPATGPVTVTINHDLGGCSGNPPGGSCVITPSLAQGTFFKVTYSGNANINPGFDLEPHVVRGPDEYTTLSITGITPSPALVGQQVKISFSVVPTATTTSLITGTVTIIDSDNNLCTADVNAGNCTLISSKAGPKTLFAIYSGNKRFNGSQASAAHTVNQAGTTTTINAHLPDPSIMGRPVEVSYQVAVNVPGGGTPRGVVTISDSAGNICSGAVSTGRCTLTPTQPGRTTLSASYLGNANHAASSVTASHQVNDIPIVGLSAWSDGDILLGQPARLNAAVVAGSNVVYRWDFGDGSAPITSTAALVEHSYPLVGAYTAMVLASNLGSAAGFSMAVRVNDVPITNLAAQASPGSALVGQNIAFSATISAGSNVEYVWSFGDGTPAATGREVQHVYAALGNYRASVRAVNSAGTLTANSPPLAIISPIAGLTARSNSPVQYGQALAFESSVTAGQNVIYAWDFGNTLGQRTRSPAIAYTYPLGGKYTVSVTAGNGPSSQTMSLPVEITDRSILGLSATSSAPSKIDTTTDFTATVLDGTSVLYDWDFGDGAKLTGVGPTVSHSYDPPAGTSEQDYTVSITAHNSVSRLDATLAVNVYTSRETRKVGPVTISANRFRDMGDGSVRALGGITLAGGTLRLNGSDAVLYYSSSRIWMTGSLELHGDSRSVALGRGEFAAPRSSNLALPTNVLRGGVTTLSSYAVKNVALTKIDLVSGLVEGSASEITVTAPHLSLTTSVKSFTLTPQDGEITTSGITGPLSLSVAGVQIAISSASLLDLGVSAASATLTLPGVLLGRSATTKNIAIGPQGFSFDPISLTNVNGSTIRITRLSATIQPAVSGGYLFALEGELGLLLPQNRQSYSFVGTLGGSGELSLSIDGVVLNAASLTIALSTVTIATLNDSLSAASGVLRLPASLGGASKAVGSVSLATSGLLIGGSASVGLPDLLLPGSGATAKGAIGTFSLAGLGISMQISGTANVPIADSSSTAGLSMSVDPSGRLSGELRDISTRLSMFDLKVPSTTIRPDGSLLAGQSQLTPAAEYGLGSVSTSVYGVSFAGQGITFGGGSTKIVLPELDFGGFKLIALSGELVRTSTGYDISASGGFQMLDIPAQAGGGCNGIAVAATLSVDTNGAAHVQLMAPSEAAAHSVGSSAVRLKNASLSVACDIPIGSTGLSVSEIRGSISLAKGDISVSLGMTIVAGKPIFGSTYPISADVDTTLTFSPLKLALDGTVKVFSFSVANAKAEISAGSFKASLYISIVVAHGTFAVNSWSDSNGFSFTASGNVSIGLRQGEFGKVCLGTCIDLPPSTVKLADIGLDGGRFSNGQWGFKGYATFLGQQYGVYISADGDIDAGGVSDYTLARPSNLHAIGGAQAHLAALAAPTSDLLDTQEVQLGPSDSASFILARDGAAPTLSLRDPSGALITPDSLPADVSYHEFINYTAKADAGAPARLRLANAAADAPAVSLLIDGSPVIAGLAFGAVSELINLDGGPLVITVVLSDTGATLTSLSLTPDAAATYTLALRGSTGSYSLGKIADAPQPLPSGEAEVRLINLQPAGALSLRHALGLRLNRDVQPGTAGAYHWIDGGNSNLSVSDADGKLLAVAANLSVHNDRRYSVFIFPPATGAATPSALIAQDSQERARLRLINAGSLGQTLDLRLGDSLLAEGVAHADASGYVGVPTGELTLSITPYGDATSILASQTIALEHGLDYSIVALNEGGTVHLLVLTDDNTLPLAGQGRLRLINAGSDLPLNLYTTESLTLFTGVDRNAASDYRNIGGSLYVLDLWDTNGWVLLKPGVNLRDGQSYTVLAYRDGNGELQLQVFTDMQSKRSVQTMYVVSKPQAGAWQLELEGTPGPDDHYLLKVYGTAPQPELADLAVSHTAGVRTATTNWRLPAITPGARLSFFANPGPITRDREVTDPLTGAVSTQAVSDFTGLALDTDLSLADVGWATGGGLLSHSLDLSKLPSGDYHIWLSVDDGVNPPLKAYASELIELPAQAWSKTWSPTVTVTPGLRSLGVSWTGHPDADVDSYGLEVQGPTIVGTQVITLGQLLEYTLSNLDPGGTYSIKVRAIRSASEQMARSQEITSTAEAVPLSLSSDSAIINLAHGQSAIIKLRLSTPMARYPEPAWIDGATMPNGLGLALPAGPLLPTTTGMTTTIVLTATNSMEYGAHTLKLRAQGVGSSSLLSLTINVLGSPLAVTLAGAGAGLVYSDMPGIDCPGTCNAIYDPNTLVTLTAEAANGSVFAGWSGAVVSTNSRLAIPIDSAKTVTATFTPAPSKRTTYQLFLPMVMQ